MLFEQFVSDNSRIKAYVARIVYSGLLEKLPLYRDIYNRQIDKAIEKYNRRPGSVSLELSGYCNANCTTCFINEMKRKKGMMTKALAKDIIAQAKSWGVKEVHFSPFGEPLMHPYALEIIRYAKEAGMRVELVTNGFLLGDDVIDGLVGCEIDAIRLSIDGYDEASYNSIRKGLSFMKLEENVKKLMKKRRKKITEVVIFFISTINNLTFAQRMEKIWRGRVDRITSHYQHSWGDCSPGLEERSSFRNKSYRNAYPCNKLWDIMVVTWDGRVPLCCIDYDVKVELGNLKSANLKDIWHGEKAKHYREIHYRRRRGEISICSKCTSMPWWWGS